MRPHKSEAEAASDLDRRIRLIMHRNPGHSPVAARKAAEDEAAAIWALSCADPAERAAAKLHLRAMQLRAANLDMPEDAARELARLQGAAEPSHYSDR